MAGWLTKDIKDLGDIIDEFCGEKDCSNCYWYRKQPFCPGEIYENMKISHDNLKRAMIRARNDITTYL